MIRYLHMPLHIEHSTILEQILQKLLKDMHLNKMLSSGEAFTILFICRSSCSYARVYLKRIQIADTYF